MAKPGVRTSEFAISVIAMLICGAVVILQVHAGKLDALGAIGAVGAAVSLLYANKRKRVKAKDDDDKNKPPPSPPPTGAVAASALVGLSLFLSACVVNVPRVVAYNANVIREDFVTYRENVAPVTTDAGERRQVVLLGELIERNLGRLEELARKGSE